MRGIFFLAPLLLSACAQSYGANAGFKAVYLHGKATAEIHAYGSCAVYRNLSGNTLVPAFPVPGWDEPRTVKDEDGKAVLEVSPC